MAYNKQSKKNVDTVLANNKPVHQENKTKFIFLNFKSNAV